MEYISLEQKKIVLDTSRIKKVCGCAGSRKTDTMIKCGIHFLCSFKRPVSVLFLTLVGSVTDEIVQRLQDYLGIVIEKAGMSNHYLAKWKGHTIEIANYDAFIHRQLQEYGEETMELCLGTDFDRKSERLHELVAEGRHENLLLKDGTMASMLLVDEFQDISFKRAQILIEFYKKNKKTRLIVLGDMLQTIFPQALEEMKHPLLSIDELQPTLFRLNKCFRCPQGHLEVVNCMTKTFRRQYSIPPMESHFDLEGNKPLFFTHEAISNLTGSLQTAQMVFKMIQSLRQHDSSIHYKDIVIIMKRSNHQFVFQHLLQIFQRNGIGDQCLLSRTKTFANEHQPINWKEGKEKLMMLSIHGDKGKGHSVVFFLGFSGGVIPEERHFYKMEELLSQSLLNVALTRSTKYLFVGMTRTFPSFYFFHCYHELRTLGYFSWKSAEIEHQVLASVCREALSESQDPPVMQRCSIRHRSLQTPLKSIILVHQDDQCKKLMKKPMIHKFRIGRGVRYPMDDEKLFVLHGMTKLLFLLNTRPSLFKSLFQPFLDLLMANRVYYTEDTSLLCSVKDVQANRYVLKNPDYWREVMRKINPAGLSNFNGPVLILHSIFRDLFKDHLQRVLQQSEMAMQTETVSEPTPMLTTSASLWNVAIFYIEYLENNSVHNVLLYYNNYFEDLSNLQNNVMEFIKYYKKNHPGGFKKLRFQQKIGIVDVLTQREELEELGFEQDHDLDRVYFNEGYKFGMSTTIDFMDAHHGFLIDIKISTKSDLQEEWIYQNMMNMMLTRFQKSLGSGISHVMVFNALKGNLYQFRLSHKIETRPVVQKLLEKYQFQPLLIRRLLERIPVTTNGTESDITTI